METVDLSLVWPEWKIEKRIGRGSFGEVYQAVRENSGVTSRAAIKVLTIPQNEAEFASLRADGLDEEETQAYFKEIVDDFVNEIKMMEPFKGIQNIVNIEDYKVVKKEDCLGWNIYIRMELLTPFHTYTCDKVLTEEEVIALGCDICNALNFCAKCDIIHRDIKPENIFVNSFGDFKLGDFGTARKLENHYAGLSQKGTFNYMAPEVIKGQDYDARADVYSLGLVLYRLMNGNRLPFLQEKQLLSPSERQAAFERRIKGEELPPPCNASQTFAEIILKACAYSPEERFESAAQMHGALKQIKKGKSDVTEAAKPTDAVKSITTKQLVTVAIVLSIVALIGVGIFVVWMGDSLQSSDILSDRLQSDSQYSEILQGDSPYIDTLENEPETPEEQVEEEGKSEFSFENVRVMLVAPEALENWFGVSGRNANDEKVWWAINVEFDLPARFAADELVCITCSWDEIVNSVDILEPAIPDSEAFKEGRTCAGIRYADAQQSTTDTERMIVTLYIPDNPDFAGKQNITVYVGKQKQNIAFELEYLGDYVNGEGWRLNNIMYSE